MPDEDTLEVSLLVDLAQGGVAESLTKTERERLHIPTDLDTYLADRVTEDHQVVLTGNPGDGKTQHLLIHRDEHSDDLTDPFYLEDASRYENEEIKSRWMDAYEADQPGIIAINDGPLREVIREYSGSGEDGETYPVLNEVKNQLDNQIVYQDGVNPVSEADSITVIDLGNRSVLKSNIIYDCINRIVDLFYLPDRASENHIHWNLRELNRDEIQENLRDFLVNLGQLEPEIHVTLRDILRYLSYIVTGGEGTESTVETFDAAEGEPTSEFKYYNLAFDQEQGIVFSMVARRFNLGQLTHPKIDAELWTQAEDQVSDEEFIEDVFRSLKRQFIFDPSIDVAGYQGTSLFHGISDQFQNHLNGDDESAIQDIVLRINQYFDPESDPSDADAVLHIWFSHKFRSTATKSLISRYKYPRNRFSRRHPRLNVEVDRAIDYDKDFYYLEYEPDFDDSEEYITRLRVDRKLYEALAGLDPGLPYALRDDDQERRLMRFMENINAQQVGAGQRVTVRVKNTETNLIRSVVVDGDSYSEGR
jgi:hypothetical protein